MKVKSEKNKKRNMLSEMCSLFIKELGKMYIVQIVYMGGLFLLWNPLFSFLITKLLGICGYAYLTQEMMPAFFSNPLVILAVIIMFFIVSVSMQYMMLYGYEYIKRSYTNEEISSIRLLITTGQKYLALLKESYGRIFFSWMSLGIFFHIPLIYFTIKVLPVPKLIWKALWEYTYTKPIFIILFCILIIHGFLRYFRLPYMLFEGKKEKEARILSRRLSVCNLHKIFAMWLGNNLFIGIVAFVLYCVSVLVVIGFLVVFVPNTFKIAVFCTIQDHLHQVILLVMMLFGMILQTTGSILLFYRCNPEEHVYEEEIPPNAFGLKKKIVSRILILVIGLDIFVTFDRIHNGGSVSLEHFGEICLTAHRGDSQKAPENTLPAIEYAMNSTADYIEIDVQETKDGKVVLMHDSNMFRTTGCHKKVSDMTFKEVRKLDAGGWFSKEYRGTKIPTLESVLKLCKGKKCLNIEIKGGKTMPELEKKVVALIEKYDFVRQCVITSVHKSSLNKVKELNKEIVTGYILSSAYGRYYLDEEIDFLSMRASFVNERVIRLAHKYGKEVHVWTINSKKEAVRLSRLGVDNIITDNPDKIRQKLYEKSENKVIIEILKLFLS